MFNFFRKRRGVSLLVTIIFVFFLMLAMANMQQVRLYANKDASLYNNLDNARNLALSSLERGLYAAQQVGVGVNDSDLVEGSFLSKESLLAGIFRIAGRMGMNCVDVDNNAQNDLQPCVDFSVKGRAVAADVVQFLNANWFSVPLRGLGDAAGSLDGFDPTKRGCDDAATANADDPCNWNRMYVGDTVEIPLYYETREANGDVTVHPMNLGVGGSEFKLRVRAPCTGFETDVVRCRPDERVVLFPRVDNSAGAPYRDVKKDKVLMQWMIVSGDGGTVMIASEGKDPRDFTKRADISVQAQLLLNSELSAGRINYAVNAGQLLNNFVVLFVTALDSLKGKIVTQDNPSYISDFVNNLVGTPDNPPPNPRATLRLTLAGQPRRGDDQRLYGNDAAAYARALNDHHNDVPYLEYQVLTSLLEGKQPSSPQTVVRGKGIVNGVHQGKLQIYQRPPTLGGFVLENL